MGEKSTAKSVWTVLEALDIHNKEDHALPALLTKLAKDAWKDDLDAHSVLDTQNFRGTFFKLLCVLNDVGFCSTPFNTVFGDEATSLLRAEKLDDGFCDKLNDLFKALHDKLVKGEKGARSNAPDKAKAYTALKRFCSSFIDVFSTIDSQSDFVFLMELDANVYREKGPSSIADFAKRHGAGRETDIEWYLRTIRVKLRGDFVLVQAQEKCGECGEMKGEGEACSNCARLQKLLEEAQEAKRKGDWKTAKAKAEEVLAYWKKGKRKEEAEQIQKDAEAALTKVLLAEGQIRDALEKNPPDIDKAWAVWDEARELHGFEADKWKGEIQTKEGEKKRREREKREQEARDAALGRFKEALGKENWDKAEGVIAELIHLGAGKEADFRKQIDEAKANKEVRLSSKCDGALKKTEVALSGSADKANPEEILEELNKAKQALNELDQSFKNSPNLKRFHTRIAEAETKLVALGKRLTVKRLKKVRELVATGSLEGVPVVTVSWKAAEEGTPAAKWQVLRRKKGGGSPEEVGSATDRMSCTDRSNVLKIGVEYEYGVVPLAKIEGGEGKPEYKANEEAVAWSGTVVCRTKLDADTLGGKGEGEPGQKGVVTLRWKMPTGLDTGAKSVGLKLSRSDGRFKDLDVKGYGEYTDEQVETGRSYGYTLTLYIAGKDSGSSTRVVVVERSRPPEDVFGLSAKRMTSGRWLLTWNWPEGIDRVLLVLSGPETVVPEAMWNTPDAISVKKEDYERRRGWEVSLMPGTTKITVFSYKEIGGQRRRYSAGKSFPESSDSGRGHPLRVERIFCEIMPHPKRFFKAAEDTEIHAWTQEGGALPPLVVVAGNGEQPLQRGDGRTVATIPASPGGKASVTVSSDIAPQTIGIFYENPDADAGRYRLAAVKIK